MSLPTPPASKTLHPKNQQTATETHTLPQPPTDGSPQQHTQHTSQTTLGLDSGTGETKLLQFRQDGRSVETTVVATLPSLTGLFGPNGKKDAEDTLASLKSAIKEALVRRQPARCFAGMTSWYRMASASERKAVDAFFAAELPEFQLLKLTGEEEARYESIAVGFAAERSGIGMPDTQISAGGGSMQLVQGDRLFSLEQGFRKGQALLMAGEEPAVEVCRKLQESARSAIAEFKRQHQSFAVQGGTKVLGISAAYYCAKGAGVDCSGAPVKGATALAHFRTRLEKLTQNPSFLADSPTTPIPKKTAQEIANLIIFCECFEQLVHPTADVYFKREWVLDGVPFITTWSAGYFLSTPAPEKTTTVMPKEVACGSVYDLYSRISQIFDKAGPHKNSSR